MHQGIYECHELVLPDLRKTKLLVAKEENINIVANFIEGFISDALPEQNTTQEMTKAMAKRHISLGNLFLLQDKDKNYVSMACNARNTLNSGCVSLVYTPKKYRKKGYASIVTALVSQEILNRGKTFCNLFTDLKNPTSNKIYQNIGYKKIGESKHFSFL